MREFRSCGVPWTVLVTGHVVCSCWPLCRRRPSRRSSRERSSASDELPPILSGPYRIQVGDVLDIHFFKTVDLNQTRTVGPDGEIYLPIVGRVDVVGRTVDDVTKEITEGYSKEMINPQITVSVAGVLRAPGVCLG